MGTPTKICAFQESLSQNTNQLILPKTQQTCHLSCQQSVWIIPVCAWNIYVDSMKSKSPKYVTISIVFCVHVFKIILTLEAEDALSNAKRRMIYVQGEHDEFILKIYYHYHYVPYSYYIRVRVLFSSFMCFSRFHRYCNVPVRREPSMKHETIQRKKYEIGRYFVCFFLSTFPFVTVFLLRLTHNK